MFAMDGEADDEVILHFLFGGEGGKVLVACS